MNIQLPVQPWLDTPSLCRAFVERLAVFLCGDAKKIEKVLWVGCGWLRDWVEREEREGLGAGIGAWRGKNRWGRGQEGILRPLDRWGSVVYWASTQGRHGGRKHGDDHTRA